MERYIGDTMDNTNIHEMLLSEYKKLLGRIEIGIKILERLREENSKEVKLFQAISFLCIVDEMKALSWKIIDNTQDSSLAECLKHIVSDYSEYTGTMEKLLKVLIESKVYSFTVGEPVDKDALSKYFSKSSERVYFYDLPSSQLFGAAGFLGVLIDKNGCYQDCIYRKGQSN